MNTSNSSPRLSIPEKVERSDDDPAVKEMPGPGLKEPPVKKKSGAGSELAAADALTSLVSSPQQGPTKEGAEEPVDEFVLPEVYTRSGRRKAIPFPLKLMRVLSMKEYSEIITWLPDGKSFAIIRPKAFTSEILPVHFKDAKYSSFTRKLHRWGFQRHLRGDDAGAFFHKNFVRNRIDLVDRMTCHKAKPSTMPKIIQSPSPGRRPATSPSRHMNLNQAQAMASARAAAMDTQRQRRQESDLNEAIELEVSRRLRERIAAASLSRQALAVMQQQVQPSMVDPLAMQYAAMNTQFGLGSTGLGGMNTAMLNQGMGSLNAGLSQGNSGTSSATAAAWREAQEQSLLLGLSPQSDLLPPSNPRHDQR